MEGQTSNTERLLSDFAEGDDAECVRFGDMLDRYRRRVFGVFLLAATLPSLIPVPLGLSIVSGAVVALVGVQIMLHFERPWLPDWLRGRGLKRKRLRKIHERLRKPLEWLARVARPRMQVLCDSVPACIATGLQVILLGVLQSLPIPFTNVPIGCLLLVYCFALIERDGVLMLVAWALGSGAIATIAFFAWRHMH